MAIRYGFLLRLVSTLLLTVSIPALIVVWFILGNVYSEMERQNDARMLMRADSFMRYFDDRYEDMFNTAVRIGYEKKVLPSEIASHPYNILDAIKYMSSYSDSIGIADSCFISFPDEGYLVGSSHKYDNATFLKRYARDDDVLAGELTEILNGSDKRSVVSDFERASSSSAKMFVTIPITIYSKNDATVLWLIDRSSVRLSFSALISDSGCRVYIFDSDGRLVMSGDGATAADTAAFSDFVTGGESVSSSGQLRLFKCASARSGLIFVVAVPESELVEPLQTFYGALRRLLLLLAVIFTVMFLATVYINYRPISETTKTLREEDSSLPDADEISTINTALARSHSERERLSQRVTEQRAMLDERLAQRLFDGKTVGAQEFAALALPGPFWCAAVTSSTGSVDLSRLNSALSTGASPVYAFRTERESYIAFILSLADDSRSGRESAVERIRVLLPGSYGVGRVCSTPKGFHHSAVNAMIAAESDFTGIVFFEDIVSTGRSSLEISEETLRFVHCVRHGETDKALERLDRVIAQISGGALRQLYCCNLISAFAVVAGKLGHGLSDYAVAELMNFTEPEGLKNGMEPLVRSICEEVCRSNQTVAVRRTENVVRYVEDNFRDPALSLVMLSDNFGMSVHVLSRMFKEVTGTGFKEYVTTLRLRESRRLLEQTDTPVGDIAVMMGWQDVSHFIKLFKSVCGMTPLNYRREKRKQ